MRIPAVSPYVTIPCIISAPCRRQGACLTLFNHKGSADLVCAAHLATDCCSLLISWLSASTNDVQLDVTAAQSMLTLLVQRLERPVNFMSLCEDTNASTNDAAIAYNIVHKGGRLQVPES